MCFHWIHSQNQQDTGNKHDIFKLTPIYPSEIYQIPWILWIHWIYILLRENSKTYKVVRV